MSLGIGIGLGREAFHANSLFLAVCITGRGVRDCLPHTLVFTLLCRLGDLGLYRRMNHPFPAAFNSLDLDHISLVLITIATAFTTVSSIARIATSKV